MKKILALILTSLVLLTALVGCSKKNDTETSDQQKETELIQEAQQSGDMDPDATVITSRDSQGNVQIEYTNPDGTGGGGIVLD